MIFFKVDSELHKYEIKKEFVSQSSLKKEFVEPNLVEETTVNHKITIKEECIQKQFLKEESVEPLPSINAPTSTDNESYLV